MSDSSASSLIPPSRPEHQAILEARRAELVAALRNIVPVSNGPVVLEVGCGHGHFLEAYAMAHPAITCVGIDIESDRITRARRKRDRSGLTNLHFLRAEARLFLDTLPPEVRFAAVFILFPDPWPKLRHHKHRLMQPDFLAAVAARMTTGGRLYFRTDDRAYFDATERILCDHSRWDLLKEGWPFEHDTVFQSRAAAGFFSLVVGVRDGSAP